MLQEYENEHHTGMDTAKIGILIYEYTSGYPYLVSRLCQLADERLAGTKDFPDRHADAERDCGSGADAEKKIVDGMLQMQLVMEKFYQHYIEI